MKTLLLKYWDRLRSSFWFVPASMACLAVAMAGVAVELDNAIASDWLLKLGWSYSVVATFVYFLLVLRTIRRVDEVAFVPHLAVSIGVLIYFIHRVSVSIQADEVVGQVGRELTDGINRLFPSRLGKPAAAALAGSGEAELPLDFERAAGGAGVHLPRYRGRVL